MRALTSSCPSPIRCRTAEPTIGFVDDATRKRVRVPRIPEGLEHDQLAIARDGNLARRQSVVDELLRGVAECGEVGARAHGDLVVDLAGCTARDASSEHPELGQELVDARYQPEIAHLARRHPRDLGGVVAGDGAAGWGRAP